MKESLVKVRRADPLNMFQPRTTIVKLNIPHTLAPGCVPRYETFDIYFIKILATVYNFKTNESNTSRYK
jgi:hypothetical protein